MLDALCEDLLKNPKLLQPPGKEPGKGASHNLLKFVLMFGPLSLAVA